MSQQPSWVLTRFFFTLSVLLYFLPHQAVCANLSAGRIVWWGNNVSSQMHFSSPTNGLIAKDNQIVSNIVSVAGGDEEGLALTADGTVFGFGYNTRGENNVPPGLSNVISIAIEGGSSWAIRRDGTVARWGNQYSDEDDAHIVDGLSNITSIVWGGYASYLALRRDGTISAFRLNPAGMDKQSSLICPVKVAGHMLSNVIAIASMAFTPIILKHDGSLFRLGYQTPGVPAVEPKVEAHDNALYISLGGESALLPYEYTSADPILIDGKPLTNVVKVASTLDRLIALKTDGTVVVWGGNIYSGRPTVPLGLTNVIAIATRGLSHMALKRDGTVIAWSEYIHIPVPVGLSNVVAIAATESFDLAITTSSVPFSAYKDQPKRSTK